MILSIFRFIPGIFRFIPGIFRFKMPLECHSCRVGRHGSADVARDLLPGTQFHAPEDDDHPDHRVLYGTDVLEDLPLLPLHFLQKLLDLQLQIRFSNALPFRRAPVSSRSLWHSVYFRRLQAAAAQFLEFALQLADLPVQILDLAHFFPRHYHTSSSHSS